LTVLVYEIGKFEHALSPLTRCESAPRTGFEGSLCGIYGHVYIFLTGDVNAFGNDGLIGWIDHGDGVF
jgi:hypothetical protein